MKTIEIIKLMPEIISARKYKNHFVIRTNPLCIEKISYGMTFSTPLPLGNFKIWLCLKKCNLHRDGWGMKSTIYRRRGGKTWYHPHFSYYRNGCCGCYEPTISDFDPISRLVAILGLLKVAESSFEIRMFYDNDFIKNFLIDDMQAKGFPNFFKEDWRDSFVEANFENFPVENDSIYPRFYPDNYFFYDFQYGGDDFIIIRSLANDTLSFLRKFDINGRDDPYFMKNGHIFAYYD